VLMLITVGDDGSQDNITCEKALLVTAGHHVVDSSLV